MRTLSDPTVPDLSAIVVSVLAGLNYKQTTWRGGEWVEKDDMKDKDGGCVMVAQRW